MRFVFSKFSEVCGYWLWLNGPRISSGRQVLWPFFCSDIFNTVVFHLCTFHLIFARSLPQIHIPLASVLNKRKRKKLKKLYLNQGGKIFPRASQISHYILLAQTGSHVHLQRKGWKNIWTRRKEWHERPRKCMIDPPELGVLLP